MQRKKNIEKLFTTPRVNYRRICSWKRMINIERRIHSLNGIFSYFSAEFFQCIILLLNKFKRPYFHGRDYQSLKIFQIVKKLKQSSLQMKLIIFVIILYFRGFNARYVGFKKLGNYCK